MARRKTGGRDFKPGQSGNPNGRPMLPADVKQLRELTAIEFTRVVNKYLEMTKSQITEAVQDPKTPALELMVATIMHKAVVGGDHYRLGFILDRCIGKVKEVPEMTPTQFAGLSDTEKLKLFKDAVHALEHKLGTVETK